MHPASAKIRQTAQFIVSAGFFFALSSHIASAQTAPEAQPAATQAAVEPFNPLRSLTDVIGLTTGVGPRPDFVEQSRPTEKMDYSPLTGPEKKRIAVKTPEQVKADTADLMAEQGKAAARLTKLQREKAAPIEPSAKPPASQDQF